MCRLAARRQTGAAVTSSCGTVTTRSVLTKGQRDGVPWAMLYDALLSSLLANMSQVVDAAALAESF